jgi:hypothetical protein
VAQKQHLLRLSRLQSQPMQNSQDNQAQQWVSQWRKVEQHRRLVESRLGHLSWRNSQLPDFNSLEPSTQQQVLKLLASPSP